MLRIHPPRPAGRSTLATLSLSRSHVPSWESSPAAAAPRVPRDAPPEVQHREQSKT